MAQNLSLLIILVDFPVYLQLDIIQYCNKNSVIVLLLSCHTLIDNVCCIPIAQSTL